MRTMIFSATQTWGLWIYSAVVRADGVPTLSLLINLVMKLAVLRGSLGGCVSTPRTTGVKERGGTRGVCG
jgi:hypothetical protein